MRIVSVRLRLALWNVGVLALVLAAFGAAIRYTEQASQTAILDHELDLHALFLVDGRFGPPGMRPPPLEFAPADGGRRPPPGAFRHGPEGWGPGRGGPRPPRGGPGGGPPLPVRFLPARFLGPAGRPLDPADGSPAETKAGPWDPAAFSRAMRGQQKLFSNATAAGDPVRVLSVPLHRDGRAVGVLQVAAPLIEGGLGVPGAEVHHRELRGVAELAFAQSSLWHGDMMMKPALSLAG